MNTVEKLNQLDDFQAQKALLDLDKQSKIDQVLTPEIKQAIADIELEYAGMSEGVDENITKLTAEIKDDVIQLGGTVKGDHLMAVWNKGRVSWDTKSLDGYAIAHPELTQFRKEGEPSVSIRKV